MLPDRLIVRDSLTVAMSGPAEMQLRSGESEVVLLRGDAVVELVPALLRELDGSRSCSEVAAGLQHLASPDVVHACIERLFKHGIVIEPPAGWPDLSADDKAVYRFLSHPPLEPGQLLNKIQNAKLGILADDTLGPDLIDTLRRHGFRQITRLSFGSSQLESELPILDLLIALAPHMQASTLDDINLASLQAGTPWLPVDVYSGPACSLGPLITPHAGPCYDCYRSRVRSNLGPLAAAYDQFVHQQRLEQLRVSHYGMLPAGINMALSLTCLETLKFIAGYQVPATIGHNVIVDLVKFEIQRHRVLRLPRCPACSHSTVAAQGHWTV
jgi:bacteriocin biosynthesis cyclodehydratase domain-containing protein